MSLRSKFLIVLLGLAASAVAASVEDINPQVQLQDDLLSVAASNIELVVVLERIARILDFELLTNGSWQQKVDIEIDREPPKAVLQKLVGGYSHALTMEGGRVKQLMLFAAGSDEASLDDRILGAENAEALGQVGSKELFPSTNDKDPAIRRVAVQQVLALEPRRAAQVLKDIYLSDESVLVRSEALTLLQTLGASAAYEVIVLALADPAPELRAKGLEILVILDEERAAQYLGQVLLGDSDPTVRLLALQLLAGHRYNREFTQALIALALNDPDQQVKDLARQFRE